MENFVRMICMSVKAMMLLHTVASALLGKSKGYSGLPAYFRQATINLQTPTSQTQHTVWMFQYLDKGFWQQHGLLSPGRHSAALLLSWQMCPRAEHGWRLRNLLILELTLCVPSEDPAY